MDRNVNFRMHEGTFMVIEANAKKNHQTVSDWLRHAVEEQIKRTVNDRALDRIDERVYDLTKSNKELIAINQDILSRVEKLQNKLDGMIVEAVS